MKLLPQVPARLFKPYFIEAADGLLIISDTHCGDPTRNPGYGDELATFIDTLSPSVVIVLNGDVGHDSDNIALFPQDITQWSAATVSFWQSLARFIGYGGTVYFIPATHNRNLEQWYLNQPAGCRHTLADYPNWHEVLPPDLGQAHSTMLRCLGQLRLAPSLVATVGTRKLLIDHGNTFDWVVPWLHALAKIARRWRKTPLAGSRFNQPMAGGAFILNMFRGIERNYAARANEYGCATVLLGHWHCPTRQREIDGVKVIVASLCTDGACIITRVLPNGRLLFHNLLER